MSPQPNLDLEARWVEEAGRRIAALDARISAFDKEVMGSQEGSLILRIRDIEGELRTAVGTHGQYIDAYADVRDKLETAVAERARLAEAAKVYAETAKAAADAAERTRKDLDDTMAALAVVRRELSEAVALHTALKGFVVKALTTLTIAALLGAGAMAWKVFQTGVDATVRAPATRQD